MLLTETTALIHVNPEDAFAYTSDMNNLALWAGGVKSAHLLTPGPMRVGSLYRCKILSARRGPLAYYQVEEFLPNERLVMRGENAAMFFRDTFLFEPALDGVLMSIVNELEFRRVRFLLEPFAPAAIRLHQERHLAHLKKLLEDAFPPPQPASAIENVQLSAGRYSPRGRVYS